jgi:hypothetical protein
MNLNDRMEAFARNVVGREAVHADDLAKARARADSLHSRVTTAITRFNEVVSEGVADFRIDVTPLRIDDKHLHAIEFDLERGRHRAVITVKSKGEVTLVGPFRAGKNEGPCRSFPFAEEAELEAALGDFLERFLEEAAAP